MSLPIRPIPDRGVVVLDEDGNLINLGNPFPVTMTGGGGSGGSSLKDLTVFTEGVSIFTVVGGEFNDSGTDPTSGQGAAARITSKRALHINLRDATGVEIGTSSAPIRIDPTGTTLQPVSDGGGSLTVDGTVSVSSLSGTVTVDQVDSASLDYDTGVGTVNQTVFGIALPGSGGPVAGGTTSDPIRIDPTGTTAQPVTDNGGSLTVDAPAATPVPIAITDTSNTLVKPGDAANAAIRVNIVAGGASGGTSAIDETPFTEAVSLFTPIGGVYNDALAGNPSVGDQAATRITQKRGLHVNLRTAAGVELGTASAPIRTDPTGSTAQPITDNGGSITVDGSVTVSGTIAATQSGSWAVDVTDRAARLVGVVYGSQGAQIKQTATNDNLAVEVAVGGTLIDPRQIRALTASDVVTANQGGSWTVAVSGTTVVTGNKTNDTAAPDATNIGALAAVATASVPSYTEGHLVALSTDLAGSLRARVTNTVTVSGTVAATQSGSWTVTANAGAGTFAVDQIDTASLDYDTGAGTVNQTVMGIALPASGGPVAGGTATNPVRIDPTGSTAQPVTDNGGSLTIDDGGGSITVDAPAATPVPIAITDTSDTLVKAGDATNNAIRVNLVAGGSSGGFAQQDKSAFTEGTTFFNPIGGVFNETIASDPTEDQAAAARITAKRALHVNLRSAAGVEIGTSGAPIRIDPTGSTTQPVSGTVAVSSVGGTVTISGTVTIGTALPAGANLIGKVDVNSLPVTTNAGATVKTFDYDTGAGTDTVTAFGIALPASGGAVAGGTVTNPVRIDPTGTTTQPVDTELPAAAVMTDTMANPTTPWIGAFQAQWDPENSQWTRQRGNTRVTLLASSARTATADSAAVLTYNYRRFALIVNVTANTGAISIKPTLQIQDHISGNWFTVWTGPNINSQSTFAYYFADGASQGDWSQIRAFGIPGAVMRLEMLSNNGNSATYSASGHLMN